MGTNEIPHGAGAHIVLDALREAIALPFAEDASQFHTQRIPLDDARTEHRLSFTGTMFWIYDASDLNAVATFKFNEQLGRGLDVKHGMSIRGFKFDRIYMTNTAQAGKYIDVLYGVEKFGSARLLNASLAFTQIGLSKATVLDTAADVSCANAAVTEVLAANAARRTAILQNIDAAAVVRVGDSNVTATRGIRLSAGDSIEMDTTESIQVRNDSGAAVDIAVAWTED